MEIRKELFIGGAWVPPATPEVINVISPATEEPIGQVPAGSPADIDAAVAAARQAFDESDWQWRPVAERAEIVAALAAALTAIANDSDYGLSGSVWTSDVEHGEQLAYRMRTGVVAINSQAIADLHSPFGGFKKSGIGRECGPEGIGPYTEYQSVVLPPQG